MIVFGVDVGGSGIKGAPVDVGTGELTGKRRRIPTPRPAAPGPVIDTIARLVDRAGWSGPVGVALPSVVQDGVVRTAANIDPSWIGVDARSELAQRLGVPVEVINDADAAGLAEVTFGAARAVDGVVLVLTFGTGIGSGVFFDGTLVPNTELGHLEFRGMEAERYAAARLVEEDDMNIEWWASRVGEYLRYLERIFWPRLFVFGGGISKRFETFSHIIETSTPVVPAGFRNLAGIIGAAYAAAGEPTEA